MRPASARAPVPLQANPEAPAANPLKKQKSKQKAEAKAPKKTRSTPKKSKGQKKFEEDCFEAGHIPLETYKHLDTWISDNTLAQISAQLATYPSLEELEKRLEAEKAEKKKAGGGDTAGGSSSAKAGASAGGSARAGGNAPAGGSFPQAIVRTQAARAALEETEDDFEEEAGEEGGD